MMRLLPSESAYVRANADEADTGEELINLPSLTNKYVPLQNIISTNSFHENIANTSSPTHSWIQRKFSGWRAGAFLSACCAMTCLLINVITLILIHLYGSPIQEYYKNFTSLVELFDGDCDKVHQMSVWSHLAINVVSTLLLSGSNYCMQCLCAPTRKEIDAAHSRGDFMDIGVLSFRNLQNIARQRSVLWTLLAITSIPLHLL